MSVPTRSPRSGEQRRADRSPPERISGERQVHDHFMEVAARAQRVEDGIATDLDEVAMPGRDGSPQRRDRTLGACLALGGLDRPLAPRHAPEDVRAGQVVEQ